MVFFVYPTVLAKIIKYGATHSFNAFALKVLIGMDFLVSLAEVNGITTRWDVFVLWEHFLMEIHV